MGDGGDGLAGSGEGIVTGREWKKRFIFGLVCLILASGCVTESLPFSPKGAITPPVTEKLELSFSENPEFNKPVELTFEIIPPNDSKDEVTLKIELPEGIEFVSGDLEWEGYLIKDTPFHIKAVVKPVKTGDWTIKGWLIISDDYVYEPLYVTVSEGFIKVHNTRPSGWTSAGAELKRSY